MTPSGSSQLLPAGLLVPAPHGLFHRLFVAVARTAMIDDSLTPVARGATTHPAPPRERNYFMAANPLFSVNMGNPDIYELIRSKRKEITRLAGKYGASHIRIFGSVARHEADEKSDIDFLVELEPGRTLFDLGGFAYDLERLLGRHVDVCTLTLLREPIRTRVVAEAVPL